MEDDDGYIAPRGCVIVPAELVDAVCEVTLQVIREWHEDNDFDIDPLVCAATMKVVGNIISDMMVGSTGRETMQ